VLKYNYANLHHPGGEPFSLVYLLFNATMSIAGWSWVVFMLSLGAKYFSVKGKLATYSNFALIMIMYEVLVRPFNVMRFFFGMRPKKSPSIPSAAPPEVFGA
jgi:hypothetical protein